MLRLQLRGIDTVSYTIGTLKADYLVWREDAPVRAVGGAGAAAALGTPVPPAGGLIDTDVQSNHSGISSAVVEDKLLLVVGEAKAPSNDNSFDRCVA